MSCACEYRKYTEQINNIRRLAKLMAIDENVTIAIYKNDDGTYGFNKEEYCENKNIVEYISPY